MRRDPHLSVQGACCLDIGFRHMFSALDGVTFSWCISRAVRFPSCPYTDARPGVGSLVGWEFSQSLEARLLVSVLRWVGATSVLYCIFFTHDNIINSHVVLFVSTVIFNRCFIMYILCGKVY